jgi:DNA polymerase III subunit epsilon
MSRYAVFDIETTGFSAAHNHRILEVAVVLVDDAGSVVYEWETLLNPQRDVGATKIHGLTAADVYAAPTFAQIAAELEFLLRGRVPVAHNLSFDARFLAAEFGRLGYSVPLDPTSGLCTMRLASHYLPTGPRTLEACCGCIGYSIESAHAALDDARATAHLLSYYMNRDGDFLGTWGEVISVAQRSDWPAITARSSGRVSRQTAAAATSQHFLERLASRAPRTEIHPDANSYLALLDRVLLDRQISRHEEDELVSTAQMIDLSNEDAEVLHRFYLAALGRLALEDGVITPEERADIESVATALGLSAADVDASLEQVTQTGEPGCEISGFTLKPGDAVVFTGEVPGEERSDLEYQARSLGLRVTGAVSGKTTLLVAADPDSISGKARKSRDLGIPIVDYTTYLKMVGSMTC